MQDNGMTLYNGIRILKLLESSSHAVCFCTRLKVTNCPQCSYKVMKNSAKLLCMTPLLIYSGNKLISGWAVPSSTRYPFKLIESFASVDKSALTAISSLSPPRDNLKPQNLSGHQLQLKASKRQPIPKPLHPIRRLNIRALNINTAQAAETLRRFDGVKFCFVR